MPILTPHQPAANSPDPKALIPGLPDDVAELCLVHLPYPYQALARSVSSSWNRVLRDPGFLLSRTSLSLSLPFLFVFAFHETTSRIQWQALDPRSGRWFVLPPMPCPKSAFPPAFACAAMPRQGKLFVLGGMRSDTESPMRTAVVYQASTNQWSTLPPMRNPRAFFAAGVVGEGGGGGGGGGRIVVAGGSGADLSSSTAAVECYDPREDAWREAAGMVGKGMVRYDSAVVAGRMYVTEGWTWPFMFTPRGSAYDAEGDRWREMGVGMRDGWTGLSVVVGERLFVISEHGDHQLKVYDPEEDTWRYVGGDKFPCEKVHKPFAASAVEEKEEALEGVIYVVGSGLHVGVGRVRVGEDGGFWVEWRVLAAPEAFQDLSPCNCQVLYA
ncbi:hypothetical protein ACJRO7_016711 [Eucalyptus globulus]|uniref:F-box domain-containing protein n=1 Tax=Eucalyptus globulus TaxID=34317 RepID=A0ABD3L7X9_EUCGL